VALVEECSVMQTQYAVRYGPAPSKARVQSSPPGRQSAPGAGQMAMVARAFWPRKTAAHWAAAAHVSEAAAKHWLHGHRKPSAAALVALIEEMVA
jgi:hypothetical protein